MIDEPVPSGMLINLNCAEVHKMSSSDIRDKCMINDAAALIQLQSRSETASNEFLKQLQSLKFCGIGTINQVGCACKAAEPRGIRLTRLRQSCKRSYHVPAFQTKLISDDQKLQAELFVNAKPGMMVLVFWLAKLRRPFADMATNLKCIFHRRYKRISVATWSLRLRPV